MWAYSLWWIASKLWQFEMMKSFVAFYKDLIKACFDSFLLFRTLRKELASEHPYHILACPKKPKMLGMSVDNSRTLWKTFIDFCLVMKRKLPSLLHLKVFAAGNLNCTGFVHLYKNNGITTSKWLLFFKKWWFTASHWRFISKFFRLIMVVAQYFIVCCLAHTYQNFSFIERNIDHYTHSHPYFTIINLSTWIVLRK